MITSRELFGPGPLRCQELGPLDRASRCLLSGTNGYHCLPGVSFYLGGTPDHPRRNVEVPIVMDMTLSTLVVLGLVLLAVLLVVGYVALRVGFGRAQSTGNLPSPARSQRDDTKRAKLH